MHKKSKKQLVQMESVPRMEGLGQEMAPSEMDQLRALIKSENDKIRMLVEKVARLKVAVKI